ncbi:MAG TPA: hypothetical protein VGL09_17435 [Methylomirabilota bacterium]
MEFYNQRRGIVARYGIEAPLPAAAVRLARTEVLADHPPARARGKPTLFARAERAGGQDGSGWVLYRIGHDTRPGSADTAPAEATEEVTRA